MSRLLLAAIVPCFVAGFWTQALGQSKAHQLAFEYGQIIGKAVWCDITADARDLFQWRAELSLNEESFNDPERSAAKRKLKQTIAQTARTRPAEDCAIVEAAFDATLTRLRGGAP